VCFHFLSKNLGAPKHTISIWFLFNKIYTNHIKIIKIYIVIIMNDIGSYVYYIMYIMAYLLSGLLSYIFINIFIKLMVNYKYGIDLHKQNNLKIAEMGGIIPVSLSSLILLVYAPMLSVVLILSGIIGTLDDIYKLSSKVKFIAMGLVGIPVSLFLGLDVIHTLIAMLGIAIYSNFTNMLAGFNGLEIGVGILSAIFLGIILLLNGDTSGFNVIMLFVSCYFGLFLLNKYPAKVFPGDVGTLPIGAFLATVAIWKNLIPELIIIMLPHFIDASLKLSTGFTNREKQSPTKIDKEGKLYVDGGYLSIMRYLLMKKPMKEYNIVFIMWFLSMLCGLTAILYNIYFKII